MAIDLNVGTAGATAAEQAAVKNAEAFLGGFAPDHLAAPAETPAPEVVAPTPDAPKPETPPKEEDLQKQALAEIIKEQREARKAREAENTKAKALEAQLSEAQAEVERLKRANDFEEDPIGYARARGWDKEKQVLLGQMLLYDLVPDKAPADLRQRLFESKQARKEREAEEKREAEAKQAQLAHGKQQFDQFVTVLDMAVKQFDDGSYPESTAWFINPETGETDHHTYMQSLIATANAMADRAARDGQVADLSPASIAKALEVEVAKRMKAREARVQKRTAGSKPQSQQVPVVTGGGVQPTESTKGLTGAGTPRPAALTEEERIKRAIAALDRPRG